MDISALAALQKLQKLNISTCSSLLDWSPLQRCASLTSLNASNCSGVRAAEHFAACHALQV